MTETCPAVHDEQPLGPPTGTHPFTPVTGTAVDPLVEEVSWQSWVLRGADPAGISPDAAVAASMGFGLLVKAAWQPGRSALMSEVLWDPRAERGAGRLLVTLSVGVLGPAGTTADELAGLRPRAGLAVDATRIYAAEPLGAPAPPDIGLGDHRHAAHLLRTSWSLGDGEDLVEVPSPAQTTATSWSAVTDQLTAWTEPLRFRATVLATQLAPEDRLALDDGLARIEAIRGRNGGHPGLLIDADRAATALLELRSSLEGPLLIAEIAVTSPAPLPTTLLRSMAASFSPGNGLRRTGATWADLTIEADPPRWRDALALGVPLRGGLGPRDLRHVQPLDASPIGWPLPLRGALPSIAGERTPRRSVSAILRSSPDVEGTVIGASGAVDVSIPLTQRTRHMLVTGTWGAGKSTLLFTHALADLRAGRRFLFLDPHGSAVGSLVAFAHQLGVDPVIIDPLCPETSRLRILPLLEARGGCRTRALAAGRRVTESVASSLPNPEWTGPRFFAAFEALLEVLAVHGGELVDAAVWLNDVAQLRQRLAHPLVSDLARTTLRNLTAAQGDGADVRGWVSSKLHPLVSGEARRILAPAGGGADVAVAVAEGRPVMVSLAGLSTSEAALVGHLALGMVLDAALDQPAARSPLVTCYVDEAHRFPVRGLSRVLAEGRKFGVGLVLATQALGQLPPDLADIAMGAGAHVAFRATPDTAVRMSTILDVTARELMALPDLNAVVGLQGHPAAHVVVPPCEGFPSTTGERRQDGATPPAAEPAAAGTTTADLSRPVPLADNTLVDDFLAR